MVTDFNLTGEALRNLYIFAVDVSEGAVTPEWEIQGYKTEDTSMEFNPEVTTVTDVLGDTYTDVDKFEEQIAFEPNTFRPFAKGGKLSALLLKYKREGTLEKFSQFRVLEGFGMLGTPGAYEADVHEKSTIYPTSMGGSSRTNFPFTVHLGGEITKGTIDTLKRGLTFTPAI